MSHQNSGISACIFSASIDNEALIETSHFYQFQELGDDDIEPEYSSTDYDSLGMRDPSSPLPYVKPALADQMVPLDPIIDSKVLNVLPESDTPQIFAACGRGAKSTFRTLRHGLEIEQISAPSPLSGIPNAVWTTRVKEVGAWFL